MVVTQNDPRNDCDNVQCPILVADGESHTIIVTIGNVEDSTLDRSTVILTVDGKHGHMKPYNWDMDALKDMDPFFGGLPSYEPTG